MEQSMSNGDDKMIVLKRIATFLAGALLTFAVMNFTVVAKEKARNEALTAELDASRYEAGRLLSDAQAQLESGEYERARTSLAALLDKHPGSAESSEGRKLLVEITDANAASDAKWAAALQGLKLKWTAERVAAIRAESEAARVQMENGMKDKIALEWENSKDAVRKEWEAAARQ